VEPALVDSLCFLGAGAGAAAGAGGGAAPAQDVGPGYHDAPGGHTRGENSKRRRVDPYDDVDEDGVRAPIASKMVRPSITRSRTSPTPFPVSISRPPTLSWARSHDFSVRSAHTVLFLGIQDCLLPGGPPGNYNPNEGAYDPRQFAAAGPGFSLGGAFGGMARVRSQVSNDPFRDFHAEIAGASAAEEDAGSANPPATSRLSQLFAPPLDLIHQGDLMMVRTDGTALEKWVLVSIQKNDVFECQKLNRDIFRDETVRSLIGSSFVLWQRSHDR
jgi:hypothetical protein